MLAYINGPPRPWQRGKLKEDPTIGPVFTFSKIVLGLFHQYLVIKDT